MPLSSDKIVPHIVEQHREETAHLLIQRWHLLKRGDVKPWALTRLDKRLAAHLDGLRVAARFGMKLAWNAALEQEFNGADSFAAIVLLLEQKNVDKYLAAIATNPSSERLRVAAAAFGWVSPQFLQGTIKSLLSSDAPLQRHIGIICCALHRVDPGQALVAAISDDYLPLRTRALKAVGELGRHDLVPVCEKWVNSKDPAVRFWAAWSAALLGSKNGLTILSNFGLTCGRFQQRALALLLKTIPLSEAHVYLQNICKDPANLRALIQGSGFSGDPFYIPWLIKQMADPKLARLAGEAFSFITGVDLAHLALESAPPADFASGPNDDPNDDHVDPDSDDNLPWPDSEKIALWWQKNQSGFKNGTRYFMGALLTHEHCVHILKEGFQRQRIAAAQYLCLMRPGSILFPTSAPSWRQQRLLTDLN